MTRFNTGAKSAATKFEQDQSQKIMKTSANISSCFRWSISAAIFWSVLIQVLFFQIAHGQLAHTGTNSVVENKQDADFPGRKKFNAGVLTTYTGNLPPPALVGELTYGVSRKLSVGILSGTTGAQSLAGVKLSSILIQRNQFRAVYRMVIVYYPGRNGTYLFDRSESFIMPWMLSMGAVDGEWQTAKGIRWSFGMGLLETHCIEGMKQYFWGRGEEGKVSPFEIFHTAQGSVSIPVSKKLTLRPEIIVVMKDWQLVSKGEFKVLPVNPFVKVVYSF